ncbi:hypothetical protein [Klebsiella quasipneumoniae]|uniref:hypothetical protein n=1 Tax=Klebsiella quasipneumoniae TaxID=1463165 RepID=UPI003F6DFE73
MQLREDGVEIKSEIKNERDGINYKFKHRNNNNNIQKDKQRERLTSLSSLLTQKRKDMRKLKIDDRIVDIAISAIGNNKEREFPDIGFSEPK